MRLITIITGLIVSLFNPSAQAQLLDDVLGSLTDSISDITDEVLPGISNIRIGVGPTVTPDYEGSDNYKVSAAPLISLHYRDIILVDNNHVRVNIFGNDSLIASEKFKAGPSLSLNFGRNESNNIDLTGLGDVGTSVEAGIFASYQEGPTRARVRIRKDITSGHSGMEIIGDFRVVFYKTEKITIVSTVSGSWADNNYMDSFFSINPTSPPI